MAAYIKFDGFKNENGFLKIGDLTNELKSPKVQSVLAGTGLSSNGIRELSAGKNISDASDRKIVAAIVASALK